MEGIIGALEGALQRGIEAWASLEIMKEQRRALEAEARARAVQAEAKARAETLRTKKLLAIGGLTLAISVGLYLLHDAGVL